MSDALQTCVREVWRRMRPPLREGERISVDVSIDNETDGYRVRLDRFLMLKWRVTGQRYASDVISAADLRRAPTTSSLVDLVMEILGRLLRIISAEPLSLFRIRRDARRLRPRTR